jgi:broad specificity phosphatase PhoE
MRGILNVPIAVTPLLAERRNPSAVLGRSTHDPEVQDIVGKIERGYHNDEFRYADEENFTDLKERAAQCARYLKRHHGSRIALVTHHAFLQMFLSYLLYRESLHAEDYIKLAFFNQAENGGITICEYHPWRRFSKTKGWVIVEYNQSIP